MAGGGIGTPIAGTTSQTPATSTPSTPAASTNNYGMPKFEMVPEFNVNSGAPAAPTTGSTPAARTPPGTPFMGLPPWLSMWSGANYGGSSSVPVTSGGYTPYVPGAGLTGYGGYRPPTIYTPPPKPASTDATKSPVGIPEIWNPSWEERMGSIDPSTGLLTVKQPSAEQRRLMDWFSQYTQQQTDARNSGNWGN